MSLRLKLVLFSLLVPIACFCGAGYVLYQSAISILVESRMEQMRRVADIQVFRIRHSLARMQEGCELVAADEQFLRPAQELAASRSQDAEKRLEIAMTRMIRLYPHLRQMRLFSPTGTLLASTPAGSDRLALAKSRIETGSGRAQLLGFAPQGRDNFVIDYLIPLTAERRLLGYLDCRFDGAMLTWFLRSGAALGDSGEIQLACREGEAGARPLLPLTQPPGGPVPEVLSAPQFAIVLVEALTERQSGERLDGRDHRGVPVLACYRYLEREDLALVVQIARAEVYAPIARLQQVFLLGGLAAASAVVLLALFWTHLLTRPLLALANLAQAVAQGQYHHRLGLKSRDELGTLARAFNHMAESLQNLHRDLAGRIHERTVALTEANRELQHEVQERQRAEGALRESERRFRLIVEETPYAIMLHEEGGRITLVNRAWRDATGYRSQELPSLQTFAQQYLPAAGTALLDPLAKLFRDGQTVVVDEIPVKHPEGGTRYWSLSSVLLGGEPPGPRLAVSMIVDISKRKLAEDALMRSHRDLQVWLDDQKAALSRANQKLESEIEERRWAEEELQHSAEHLRSFVEHCPAAIAMFDRHMNFVLASRRWLLEYGLLDKHVTGRSYYELLPETPDTLRQVHERCLQGMQERCEAEVWRHPTGKQDWVRWEIHPWHTAAGEIGGIIMVTEIITQRRRTEEQLASKARELARSNQELQEFAYIASHDLQEPLRMIVSFLELLQRRHQEKLDDEAREYVNFAVDGALRMRQLIQDLLQYSRVGTQERTSNTIDAQRALDAALRNLTAAIQESGAQIVSDTPLPRITADTTQLVQLFQNLIGNAIKYAREGVKPEIHVRASERNDDYVFAISDNGIGIEKQYFERIFKVFERLHTRQEKPGTGIGLALCTKILHYHGGRIWVESEPGKGSTFYFSLPARYTPPPQEPPPGRK